MPQEAVVLPADKLAAPRSKFPEFAGERGPTMATFSPEYMADLERWVIDDVTYVPDRILAQLALLEIQWEGQQVNQLEHSLQTATRAERAGGDLDTVVGALVHDLGKVISNANHPVIAAEMVRPWIDPDIYWVIKVHQDFQGIHYFARMGVDPMLRRRHRDRPAYELAERFVDEWDNAAFDPEYDTEPLAHFEPMVRELFSRPARWPDHWRPAESIGHLAERDRDS